MPIDRLLDKAKKLLESGRVELIGQGVYNVIGDHGTYFVARDHTGKVSCNCQGFLKKGICSHATAIMLLSSPKRGRRKRTDASR